MTDKEKIREEVEKIAKSINPFLPDENGKNSEYEAGRFAMVTQIMQIIDSMQEEPVSEELEEAINQSFIYHENRGDDFRSDKQIETAYWYGFEFGAKWQKAKDEYITEDLGEYISELAKQFSEVSFAKLSRIAVRVAKWQKEQMMANAVDGAFIRRNRYTKKNVLNGLDMTCDAIQCFKDKDKIKVLFIKED